MTLLLTIASFAAMVVSFGLVVLCLIGLCVRMPRWPKWPGPK